VKCLRYERALPQVEPETHLHGLSASSAIPAVNLLRFARPMEGLQSTRRVGRPEDLPFHRWPTVAAVAIAADTAGDEPLAAQAANVQVKV